MLNTQRPTQSLTCNNGRYIPRWRHVVVGSVGCVCTRECCNPAVQLPERRCAPATYCRSQQGELRCRNDLKPAAAQWRLPPHLRRDVVGVGCLLEWREHRPVDLDDDDHHDDVAFGSSGNFTHREEHQPDGWQPLHATDHGPDTRRPGARQSARQPPEELRAGSVQRKETSVDPDTPAVPELLPDHGGVG